MKKQNIYTLLLGILTVILILLTSLNSNSSPIDPTAKEDRMTSLSDEALLILEKKCNTCHRKQNPFMVFNKKNMNRRVDKIYIAVFISKRMPKNNETPLSELEYNTLKRWAETLNSK